MPKAKSKFNLCRDPAKATVEKFYEFKNATDCLLYTSDAADE